MRLRVALMLAGSILLVALSPALAQSPTPYRIAYLSPESESSGRPMYDAFRSGLHQLGYDEGRNVVIEARWGDGVDERLERYAIDIVRWNPNVIVAQTRAALALRRAGGSMPVVFAFSGDPVLANLVDSFARPGGRFTGMSMLSLELTAKRMELLKELMPNLKRVAILANPAHPGEEAERLASQASAQRLNLKLEYFPVRDEGQLEPALRRIQQAHCEAIVVFPDAGTMTYSKRIAAFTAQTGIPAISGWVAFAEGGNLATYGPELRDAYTRLASYVDKILKGTSPAQLPVELPTKVELAINIKTVEMLGLNISPALALRVDRLIR